MVENREGVAIGDTVGNYIRTRLLFVPAPESITHDKKQYQNNYSNLISRHCLNFGQK
jgi:hypothetical protein